MELESGWGEKYGVVLGQGIKFRIKDWTKHM
jgi:hypothetical protein